jgi:hypothetical protein
VIRASASFGSALALGADTGTLAALQGISSAIQGSRFVKPFPGGACIGLQRNKQFLNINNVNHWSAKYETID